MNLCEFAKKLLLLLHMWLTLIEWFNHFLYINKTAYKIRKT